MKNVRAAIYTAMLVLSISAPALAKTGTISTTRTGTISTTKSGTISTTASSSRTGTISTTRTGLISTTRTIMDVDRTWVLELLFTVYARW